MTEPTTEQVVARTLEAMTVEPPENLLPDVLVATGLADGYVAIDGPAGTVLVAFNGTTVIACVPIADEEALMHAYESRGRRVVEVAEMPARLGAKVGKALETGKLGTLPVDLSSLSEFQQAVLRKTAEIPPGEVRPYSWVAREIGKPGALRAVGTALGKNPIPVLIPCHRVVRSDGTMGNYAFGPDAKKDLLEAEGLDVDSMEANALAGKVLTGSDTTKIYCYPSCRHARRTSEQHTMWFGSAREAAASGYRPCKVCRPEAIAA